MILDAELQKDIVSQANRAPSVHNTQPARWEFLDGCIQIYADESRFLNIGDPSLQDAGLSCGAALEGTIIALSDENIAVSTIEDFWKPNPKSPYKDMRLAAKLTLKKGAKPDPLSPYVNTRFTWRGLFDQAGNNTISALDNWAQDQEDITLVTAPSAINDLAKINDNASLKFFKNKSYRQELLSYMRLSKRHPLWSIDGLNHKSMQLSSIEAVAAGVILRSPIFEGVCALGMGKTIVSEAAKTKSASAIVFFTMPIETSPITMGRAFYRRWLEMTQLGFALWPMAVLADDPQTAANCMQIYNIAKTRKIVNVFRLGLVPEGGSSPAARLPNTSLILND